MPTFLGNPENCGFLYIRSSFQCLQNIIVPENGFLIGILIQRTELPWAKVFPLRLMLRMGALNRYYPCPHVSVARRPNVYADIGQTIMTFLAVIIYLYLYLFTTYINWGWINYNNYNFYNI